ncbi:Nem1-Spo7 phosphatase regulatory subunit [Cladophialophora chaetospira]|uniref:Nem1-Spo7 phosphatase regulatory subunit n=1 Tax=Cladophialophora chaetospira TaxID=386627 RepID=A0AA38XJC6_9EURO|nr:Nem1-Spo7 phosphatase regulatory subunit [Cladophialophora chaetospira]
MSNQRFTGLTFLHGPSVIYAEEPLPSTTATMTSASPETRLNQIVKGAPTTNISASATPPPLHHLGKQSSEAQQSTLDPHLSTLPSSPPQIYLNLLILESSLRAQYLHLVSRRRLNTFFLLLLAAWNFLFFYALFLRPREDGTGLGGSVYWVVETSEKLALMGGIVTLLLVLGTGQWERGIRWPRKWLGTTNRGLRTFNLRVVIIRKRFWREALGHLSFLLPFGLWREAGGSDWHFVEHETGQIIEEDLARGGDGIMLLLLPKSFSPEFRQNWEEYRTEYWEKENERRTGLRRKLDVARRAKAKEMGGWQWWTGAWKLQSGRHHHGNRKSHDLEKHPHGHHLHPSHRSSLSEKVTHSRSRQSSRSSTPHLEFDGAIERPLSERMRRGSSVSSTASVRRKPRDRKDGTPTGTPLLSPLTSTTAVAEDEKEERRRRRRDREAAKKEREKEEQQGTLEPAHHHHHKRKLKPKPEPEVKEETGNGNGNGYEAGSSVPTTPMNGDGFSLDLATPPLDEDKVIKAER